MAKTPTLKDKLAAARAKADLARDKAQIARRQPRREPIPDPLAEVPYGQGIEADADHELSALLKGFQERAKQEQDRFVLATDSEFWFCVGFQSREQKDLFLKALNWLQYGDKYLDGTLIAQREGIDLPAVTLSNKRAKPDPKLIPLVKR
jgi:23S rRNA G2445 N2-methylase RlmL